MDLPRNNAPRALVVSADLGLLLPTQRVIGRMGLRSETWAPKAALGRGLRQPNVRLVVIDDSALDPTERTRLLAHVRRYAPDARVLYVAGSHSLKTELQARRGGINYYLTKPVDPAVLTRVLQWLVRSIR